MLSKDKAVPRLLHQIEQIGLLVILVATVIAVGQEIMVMVNKLRVDLIDLLLLFIYLEIVAMIKIYYQQHRLPIRFPIYIAIVAMARFIILDSKSFEQWRLLEIGLTILVLAFAVFIVRYGHVNYPYKDNKDGPNED
jgi:protein PsiE